jgi:hypothetical protein
LVIALAALVEVALINALTALLKVLSELFVVSDMQVFRDVLEFDVVDEARTSAKSCGRPDCVSSATNTFASSSPRLRRRRSASISTTELCDCR